MSEKAGREGSGERGFSVLTRCGSLPPEQADQNTTWEPPDHGLMAPTMHDSDGSLYATVIEGSLPTVTDAASEELIVAALARKPLFGSQALPTAEDIAGPETPPPTQHDSADASNVWIRLPRDARDARDAEQAAAESGADMLHWHSEVDRRYAWVEKLGQGGIGEVVLVKDRLIERKVAMKRILKRSSHYGAPRFLEEVRTIGRLEHPNIVPVHDIGVDREGSYFFTMKYVEGETLEAVIEKLRAGDPAYHKRFPFEYRVRVFLEILNAVRFAHKQGVLHRDLKPSNIMLGAYGEVMVMDWGSAKRFTPDGSETVPVPSPRAFQTQDGTLVGTPAYMSPEQALGKSDKLDERSDIYSLCVLFYEFLTLRHYLEHKQTFQEILFGIVSEQPQPADSIFVPLQGNVPRDLWFFVKKGLAKAPELRYASVSEMVDALQPYLEGKIGIHCPSTMLKRLALQYARFLDTYRTTGVLVALLLLGFLAAGIFQVGAWLGRL